jgi:hypothetical protein
MAKRLVKTQTTHLENKMYTFPLMLYSLNIKQDKTISAPIHNTMKASEWR